MTPEAQGRLRREFEKASLEKDVAARKGELSVQAPRMTLEELRIVKTCLMHPKDKLDWISVVISIVSAALVIAKILDEAFKDGQFSLRLGYLSILALATLLIGAQVARAIAISLSRSPFHALALGYLESQLTPILPESGDTAPQPATGDGGAK